MKHIVLGAFEINGVNLTSQGLWAHPEHQSFRYTDIDYWIEVAHLLDRGGFDFLFFADSYGYPSIDGETPDVAFEQGTEIPKNDPMLLVPALATATERLSFAVTSSTTYEEPYANARRFATLDHVTRGRIAWNVVTTTATVVKDLFGRDRLVPHDERYAMAEEYLQLSYALFEGSWEDGSVLRDKAARRYADASKVHPVHHDGRYFRSSGYFNSEPSPQRTPVVFQAGASKAGMEFAARNAEVVFLQGRDASSLREQVATIRRLAVEAGRDARDIRTVVGLSAVVGQDRADASARLDDYLSYVDRDAMRVYFAQMTGIDLAALEPDTEVSSLSTEQSRTQVARYNGRSAAEAFEDFARRGMREFILLGTGDDIAQQMVDLVEETDVDGFNFTPFVSPGSYREFVDEVVPALRARDALAPAAPPMPFRERLFGSPRLPATHPAAAARHTTEGDR
ncbi:N5,N10-methylene tetrahydromethanopterin reductase [Agromyces rhizosphaerae]|uniref:N5,N10-methylene tetrahydromethanopterin reductase n=1 Tax=Agromyces rhizosphaerae TaxID=88374 RepID=A0A9W6FQB2_9MICO|nr:NtaA/DmoA family FMN-dependent monooxygenase [Agromyces rhizosphaerae]GLI26417.1 N5,N10-methylene tetrahydromethanopterin reductase [Agromyces rhizosphaerae]